MIDKKLEEFFNGMTESVKNRFVLFSKGFTMFAVEPERYQDEDKLVIVFINNENQVEYNKEKDLYEIKSKGVDSYKLIITETTNKLERGVYNISDLPSFDTEEYQEQQIQSKTLTLNQLSKLKTIKLEKNFSSIFGALEDDLSFSETNKLAQENDSMFDIETIFEEDNGDIYKTVKRVLYGKIVVLYIERSKYNRSYCDEVNKIVVNKSIYLNMLQYIESEYKKELTKEYDGNQKIYKLFGNSFYDYAEEQLK